MDLEAELSRLEKAGVSAEALRALSERL